MSAVLIVLLVLLIATPVVLYFTVDSFKTFVDRRLLGKKEEPPCDPEDLLCIKRRLGKEDPGGHVDDDTAIDPAPEMAKWEHFPSESVIPFLNQDETTEELLCFANCKAARNGEAPGVDVLGCCTQSKGLVLPFAWTTAVSKRKYFKDVVMRSVMEEKQSEANRTGKTVYYGITGLWNPFTTSLPGSKITFEAWELDPEDIKAAVEAGGSVFVRKEVGGGVTEFPIYIKGRAETRKEAARKDIDFRFGTQWFASKKGKNLLGYSDDTLMSNNTSAAYTLIAVIEPQR
jgi:hypothetical protein